jgi:hypothetical protein
MKIHNKTYDILKVLANENQKLITFKGNNEIGTNKKSIENLIQNLDIFISGEIIIPIKVNKYGKIIRRPKFALASNSTQLEDYEIKFLEHVIGPGFIHMDLTNENKRELLELDVIIKDINNNNVSKYDNSLIKEVISLYVSRYLPTGSFANTVFQKYTKEIFLRLLGKHKVTTESGAEYLKTCSSLTIVEPLNDDIIMHYIYMNVIRNEFPKVISFDEFKKYYKIHGIQAINSKEFIDLLRIKSTKFSIESLYWRTFISNNSADESASGYHRYSPFPTYSSRVRHISSDEAQEALDSDF